MFTAGTALSACGTTKPAAEGTPPAATAPEPQAKQESSAAEVAEGQRIFRFETFGDEQLWTDKLRLNEVVEKNVDPTTALKVGLKVDADVLPAGILEKVDLKSPATTVALLKMNAVVGLQATVDANNHITRLGVTCALCHSTVDNSVMPGIGRRKDGWPNRDLNVGAIIALSPALPADKKAVYQSWGPGKYDPRYNQDGKNTPLVLPPAYGLAQVKNETYTAEGPISYWNAYVAVTQMGGQGNFSDPRLGIDVKHSPDLVTSKLPALRAYQHSLPAPPPPAGSFDAAIAERGRSVFDRTCASCHVGGSGTDNNGGTLHAAGGHRRRRSVCGAHSKQGVPHDASACALAAPAVLPRRQRGHARRRRGALQPGSQARSHRRAAARPRRVSEVALILIFRWPDRGLSRSGHRLFRPAPPFNRVGSRCSYRT